MKNKLFEDCGKSEGATPEDIDTLIKHQSPTTRAAKCVHACIGESLGLVNTIKFFANYLNGCV